MPGSGAGEKQFGPYRLVRQLATGGMAEIHLAKTKGIFGFEKFVALKMIHPNFSSDEHFIQMLVDEAKITVQLQHVNIAQVFDLGRVGETFYITMEYIDGADLYKILRRAAERDIEVPIDVAVHVVKEVCMGLDYAHKKRDAAGRSLGIIHRDISPQNVLLSTHAEVKVVDFGIAKATMRSKQTAVGVIKGKYYYMSPEQAWAEPLDSRSDIFSTGILLYEMLIGQMLYLEEDVQRLLNLVRKADIPPPSTRRRGVPPQLDAIIMKALAKKREQRYASARDLGSDLERFLHSYSPEFTSSRVVSFYQEVMGGVADPPPEVVAEAEPEPEEMTRAEQGPAKLARAALMSRNEFTDENSVIFRMNELAGAPPAEAPRAAPAGQRPTVTSQRDAPRAPLPLDPGAARPAIPRPQSSRAGDEMTREHSGRPAPPRPALRGITTPPPGGRRGPSADDAFDAATIVTPNPALGRGDARDAGEATAVRFDAAEAGLTAPTPLPGLGPLSGEFTRVDGGPVGQAAFDDEPGMGEPTRLDFGPGLHDARQGRPATARLPLDVGNSFDRPTERRPGEVQESVRGARVEVPVISSLAAPRRSRRTPAQGLPVAEPPPASEGRPTSLPLAAPLTPSASELPQYETQEPWASPYASVDPALDDVDVRTGGRTVLLWLVGALLTVGIIIGVVAMVRSSAESVATTGTIEIFSIPPGASVRIDGREVPGKTPLRYEEASRGKTYALELNLEHYEPETRSATVPETAGQIKVIASLRPILGTLRVESTPPGAEVFVNNRSVGRTPLSLDDLDPFIDSRVEVRLRGHKPQVQPVSWSAAHDAQLSFKLAPTQ